MQRKELSDRLQEAEAKLVVLDKAARLLPFMGYPRHARLGFVLKSI